VDCDDVTFLLAAGPEASTLSGVEDAKLQHHLEICETCRVLAAPVEQLHWVVGVPSDALADRDLLALAVVDPILFEAETELARGGMGRITRARDRRLGRDVAIKEVLGRHLNARFEREVSITAQLQHPAIVPIYEAGRWPDGSAFYAMRLVSGGTLSHAIAKTRTLEERLALLPHVIALTDALAYAHSKRIVHRDLKPGNVLVGEFGETLVIDWGLAKELDRAIGDGPARMSLSNVSDLTVVGSVMGTPGFMSPEQAAGTEVDERTDVYALGTILYTLLAGKAPYWDGETTMSPARLAERENAGPPTSLATLAPRVPKDLQVIVERAMARERDARYATAKEMAEELRRFAAGQLLRSREYTTRELVARWIRRHRTAVIVGVIALVAIAIFGMVSIHQTVRRREEAELALARSRVEQGRQLLVGGQPGQAAAMLAAAIERVPGDAIARRLSAIAVRDADRRLASFTGTTAAFRLDGGVLAIGHADGSIALVDPETGATRDTLPSDAVGMTNIAYAGKQLLCTSRKGVYLVDPDTRAVVAVARGDVQAAELVGDRVAIADPTGVRLVERDGTVVRRDDTSKVRDFDVDPSGQRLLGLTPTATIVWTLPDLARVASLPAAVYARLDRDGGVVLADEDSLRRYTLTGSSVILRAGESQPLFRLHDGSLATGQELIDVTTHALAPDVASQRVASLDTTHVITGGFDRVLRIAKLDLPRALVTLDTADAIGALVTNATGTRAITVERNGVIELWDTGHLRDPVVVSTLEAPIDRIVTGHDRIAVWLHGATGNQVAMFDAGHARVSLVEGWPVGYRPGGDELAVNNGGRLFIYRDGAELQVVTDTSPIQAAAFSSSGAVLATSATSHITLRDPLTWKTIGDVVTHRDDVTALALDDAGHLVTGYDDGTLQLWDTRTGTAGAMLTGHSAHIDDVAIRGDRLLTRSWDGSTRAWDLATGAARGVVLPSIGHGVAIAPSGRYLATVDRSALVSVWDADEGRLLEQRPASSALDSVAFTDDDHVVVGGAAGIMELIDLGERERTTAEIVRLANAMGWHLVDGRIVDRRR
jgi:eukaryotic-like serine/threonine-protein kinase